MCLREELSGLHSCFFKYPITHSSHYNSLSNLIPDVLEINSDQSQASGRMDGISVLKRLDWELRDSCQFNNPYRVCLTNNWNMTL